MVDPVLTNDVLVDILRDSNVFVAGVNVNVVADSTPLYPDPPLPNNIVFLVYNIVNANYIARSCTK
jgi:hypothetical protein